LNPALVTDKTIQELLAHTLKLAGCGACGRVSKLHVEFLGDPADEVAKAGLDKLGVLGQELVGLHR
jgi:hypothetical protein